MGRCNNKRAQQAAQQLRNTPSRARFSKPPPSLRNKKKGGGRTNDKGRGGGRTRHSGRGGGSQIKSAAPSVINKLSQRVRDANTKTNNQGVKTSTSRQNPLAGLDVSKLDEIKLSEESITLVSKLLTDLNVMEGPKDDQETVDSSMHSFDEEENDSSLPLHSQQADHVRASGYSEYENDGEELEDQVSRYFHPVGVAEEDTFNDEIDVDSVDENKNESAADDETESIRQSSLFMHLTKHFSFQETHAQRACIAVENQWAVDPESDEEDESSKLGLVMDWLCLHLKEEELTSGFRPNPNRPTKPKDAGRTLWAGTGRTKAIPHESISIAPPLTSDAEWRDEIILQERTLGFVRLGFLHNQAQDACRQTRGLSAKSAHDDVATLEILLTQLQKDVTDNHDQSVEATQADLEFCREERQHEIQALEAIYADQFELQENFHDGMDRYKVSVTPHGELDEPAKTQQCCLFVYITEGYPVLEPPMLLFSNPTLPPSLILRVNRALIREAQDLVGAPAIFSLVDYLSNHVHEMQTKFVQETARLEEEQSRRSKDLIPDNDDVNYDESETSKNLGRRQRQKLKAAEKSYVSPQLQQEAENRRVEKQKKRLENVKEQTQSYRHNMAERAIEERAKQNILDEAERAARAAMNGAFLEGKSADEARDAADRARSDVLREHGVENSSENKSDNKSATITDVDDEIEPNQETSYLDEDSTSEKGPKDKYETTSTTKAFMDRLREHYEKAAKEKLRMENSIQAVASDNSHGENGKRESGSQRVDDGLSRDLLQLKQPKSIENSKVVVEHVPKPVPIPTGDLANVMRDVVKLQKEQPWLVSTEARVPVLTALERTAEAKEIQSHEQQRISGSIRKKLKQQYDSAQEWARKNENSNTEKSTTTKHSYNGSKKAEQFHRMLSQRQRLPAYEMKDEIVKTIACSQITVISGDTGCGKTTQVPQLVLDDLIWNNRGASANIIVTQPRRISAIGVTERIAAERCESVGETAGYSIRLENRRSAKTRLLLCTTGILLRRLQCDPDLASVSHVFVDEVHERDINTDFLLIILKDLLSRRRSLKLVLMSATLNAETFSAYFGGCPTVSIPGRTHPVKEMRLEDVLQITDYEVPEDSDYCIKTGPSSSPRFSKSMLRKMYYPKYGTKVISQLARLDETIINYELIAELLEHIALNEQEGAILVFLPGMMEITKAIDELRKKEIFTDPSRSVVYPLHSSLSTTEQTAVFDIPPPGVRKIVVSTNISETSITIEDVVFVVDAGRVKENRHDEVNQMPTLVECWISRASAKQRRGRAGRVRPGVAYHFFSSHTHQHDMEEYQLPEMLRVGLEDLALQVLLLDLGEPSRFLSKAVNPPSALAMQNSLKLLEGLGAIECDWGDHGVRREPVKESSESQLSCTELEVASSLTALGFHLATLPVDPRVGKMMIYGALFGCIDPALTIAASMSARNPFMSPFDQRSEADAARREFAVMNSDHLTTLNAFMQWTKIPGERAAYNFLRDNFLSRQTMFQMLDLRKQFADLLKDIGFLPRSFRLLKHRKGSGSFANSANIPNANGDNVHLIRAILCAGLYPNIIVAPRPLVPQGNLKSENKEAAEYTFASLKGEVYLHPCTISFTATKFDSRYCCYHEIVKTSKTYVRDCTPVSEFSLLLFGGSLKVYHSVGVVTVDEWLKFRCAAKPATLVKHLRAQMEAMLLKKIVSPDQDVTGSVEGKAMIQAISTLIQREVYQPRNDGAEIVTPYTAQRTSSDRRPPRGQRNNRQGRGGSRGGGRGRAGRERSTN